eukprot:774829-Pelagomonas_calceolata.AAC.1
MNETCLGVLNVFNKRLQPERADLQGVDAKQSRMACMAAMQGLRPALQTIQECLGGLAKSAFEVCNAAVFWKNRLQRGRGEGWQHCSAWEKQTAARL